MTYSTDYLLKDFMWTTIEEQDFIIKDIIWHDISYDW